MRRSLGFLVLTLASVVFMLAPSHIPSSAVGVPDFVHFESGHVRPATLTPDGQRLLVVNTADGRLSVFDLTGEAPARVAEIPVGLEPISVACLDDHTAWVVNHLSDDVSVVDLDALHVRATLWVGDEPADVVFAGSQVRAYVSVSQEDAVKVYDPASLGAPVAVVPIDGRLPRALARSADGAHVYAAVFTAGNRTTTVPFDAILEGSMPIDPEFSRSPSLPADPPNVALIVQQQGAQWRDMYGNDWSAQIPFSMHEVDIAEIATASASVTRTFGDLGTVNFAVAVSPVDGRIAVAATEALNLLRFQNRLRGRTVDTRLGLVTAAGSKSLLNLNPHINHGVVATERDSSLGVPTGIAYAPDGQRLYVTSLASNHLAVVDPNGAGVVARVPTVAGPTGVVVDATRDRIYVVGRFQNQLQTFSATNLTPVALASIGFDPTPDPIVNGRRFFYGGSNSEHGDQACASCHLFGDFDALAWDLGEPNGVFFHLPPGTITNPFLEGFDPMKGPMVTQTLRGLPGAGRMHWRGDRANLAEFNQTFRDLLGRASLLPASEFEAFSDFVLPLAHPPNPNRFLDGTLRDAPMGQPSAKRGEHMFQTLLVFRGTPGCKECHQGPALTNGNLQGGDGTFGDQDVKVTSLRAQYRKVGMSREPGAVSKRGFGFSHDGGFASIEKFLENTFNLGTGVVGTNRRRDIEAFVLSMGSGLATAVGRQVTFDSPSGTPATAALLDTLKGQSASCELIAKGRIAGTPRGWLYLGGDQWRPDRVVGTNFSTAEILTLAGPGNEVTITAVPPGNGTRMGIDRDRDTFLDADEIAGGSDPGDPASIPTNVGVESAAVATGLRSVGPNPFRLATEVQFVIAKPGSISLTIHDVLGREVRAVAKGLWLEAGRQSLRWDGRRSDGGGAAAGVYFVRLSAEGRDWVRAVVRIP